MRLEKQLVQSFLILITLDVRRILRIDLKLALLVSVNQSTL